MLDRWKGVVIVVQESTPLLVLTYSGDRRNPSV
jgi:hypothetical protein